MTRIGTWRASAFLLTVFQLVLLAHPAPAFAIQRSAESCLDSVAEVPVVTGLFVEPDDGYAPVIDEIDAARCTVDLSVYLLSDDVVLDALIAAHERGVRVRVQLEEDPFGGGYGTTQQSIDRLDAAGIAWSWTPAHFRFSHAKYLVLDRSVAVIMNLNLTPSAFYDNREFGIVTTDLAIVAPAQHVFDLDWEGREEPFASADLVTSPETSRSVILGLITAAATSIDFYAEVIRDEAFIAALLAAEARGVQVRLIVNESGDDLDNEIYGRLLAGGVEIRYSGHLYVHAKAMIFDGRTVLIGSQNPTSTSFDENREVGVTVDSPEVLYRAAHFFRSDWARAIPASPERASYKTYCLDSMLCMCI